MAAAALRRHPVAPRCHSIPVALAVPAEVQAAVVAAAQPVQLHWWVVSAALGLVGVVAKGRFWCLLTNCYLVTSS